MPKEKKSYGRSWKKYIVWYIIAAAVIYTIVYFLFMKGNGYGY